MVSDNTERNVLLVVLLVSAVCKSAYLVHQGTVCIYIEKGCHILADNSQSLESHTCIDVLLDQIGVISVSVIVELGEYDIPYFHETVSLATHNVLRACTILLSAVIVDLRARAARTCAMLPEVVLFAEAEDFLRWNTNFLIPDVECFIII